MRAGIGLVPEDRKRQGLVLAMTGLANATLPTLGALSRLTFIRHRAERALAGSYFDRLRVRTPGLDYIVAGLSGGNQQKIVLAKWLAARCRILILDEPTRGVDVGAKAEIHALIDELASKGSGVILISSELPEILQPRDAHHRAPQRPGGRRAAARAGDAERADAVDGWRGLKQGSTGFRWVPRVPRGSSGFRGSRFKVLAEAIALGGARKSFGYSTLKPSASNCSLTVLSSRFTSTRPRAMRRPGSWALSPV